MRPVWCGILLVLLVFLLAAPGISDGVGFGDCLTDCVKALGDEELDHTKLFSCSARCNLKDDGGRGDGDELSYKSPFGEKRPGDDDDDDAGVLGAEYTHNQEADVGRGIYSMSEGDDLLTGRVAAGVRTSLSGVVADGGELVEVLTKGQVEAGRGADGKLRVILSDREPSKDRDNSVEWIRLDLDGWTDVQKGNAVLGIEEGSLTAIYASHVLQSFHYRLDDEVQQTLRSWYRLLEPGGKLYLSVPDFPTLCWLYLNPSNNMNGRFRILQMMMGSQDGKHQVHRSGYDIQFLGHHLNEAGFAEYQRVPEFNLFKDDSTKQLSATFVSLNVIAHKPHRAVE